MLLHYACFPVRKMFTSKFKCKHLFKKNIYQRISSFAARRGESGGMCDHYYLTHLNQMLKTTCCESANAFHKDQNPLPTRKCCSCPLVFRGWQWQRRCSGAQVAGLAVSSARSWCVLATLHNHISPLSEQQGCCAAQQQRQQQHKLLELGRAAPDLLTESFVLISSFSFGCHLVRVYSYRCKGCCDEYYHYCWSY